VKVRNFLAGVLLGTGLTLAAAWHHHGEKVNELRVEAREELESTHHAYQANLKRAWEYAVEECPELFARNLVLETAIVEFQQELIQAEVRCLRRIAEAQKKVVVKSGSDAIGFATIEDVEDLISQLVKCQERHE